MGKGGKGREGKGRGRAFDKDGKGGRGGKARGFQIKGMYNKGKISVDFFVLKPNLGAQKLGAHISAHCAFPHTVIRASIQKEPL